MGIAVINQYQMKRIYFSQNKILIETAEYKIKVISRQLEKYRSLFSHFEMFYLPILKGISSVIYPVLLIHSPFLLIPVFFGHRSFYICTIEVVWKILLPQNL